MACGRERGVKLVSETVFQCRVEDVPQPPRGLRFRIGEDDSGIAGFLVRYGDDFRAYRNRCAHLRLELDLNPGLFFDIDERFLLCSTHAALFDPADGRCVAGPCAGRFLEPLAMRVNAGTITVEERTHPGASDNIQCMVDTTT